MSTPPDDPPPEDPVDPDNPTATGGAGVGQPPLTPPTAAIVTGPPPPSPPQPYPDPQPDPDGPDAGN